MFRIVHRSFLISFVTNTDRDRTRASKWNIPYFKYFLNISECAAPKTGGGIYELQWQYVHDVL